MEAEACCGRASVTSTSTSANRCPPRRLPVLVNVRGSRLAAPVRYSSCGAAVGHSCGRLSGLGGGRHGTRHKAVSRAWLLTAPVLRSPACPHDGTAHSWPVLHRRKAGHDHIPTLSSCAAASEPSPCAQHLGLPLCNAVGMASDHLRALRRGQKLGSRGGLAPLASRARPPVSRSPAVSACATRASA